MKAYLAQALDWMSPAGAIAVAEIEAAATQSLAS